MPEQQTTFTKMICPCGDEDHTLLEYRGPNGKYTAASCVEDEFADLLAAAPELLAACKAVMDSPRGVGLAPEVALMVFTAVAAAETKEPPCKN